MCNSKFLIKYYKSRIVSQHFIKGWEIQDLIRKDMGLYVVKLVCSKARKNTCVVKVIDCDDEKKTLLLLCLFLRFEENSLRVIVSALG